MKCLLKSNDIVNLMIGKQLYYSNKVYIDSSYIIRERVNEDIILYNTLTYELISLTQEEYENNFKFLVEHWFKIEEDIDPYSLCKTFKRIYRQTRKKRLFDKISTYTILSTTMCNAQCSYCYEREHKNKKHMTEETANKVVNFIEKTHDGTVNLSWFGGEPLYNAEVISIITKQLRSRKIPYTSSMISNGLLFDKYNIETIKYIWNLSHVQITLDGTEETYNNIKKCTDANISNPFQKVLDNIEYLISNEIIVNVRLNISEDNIEDLKMLANILRDKFSEYPRYFSVYSHPLFDEFNTRTATASKKISEGYIEIQEHLMNLGLFRRYDLKKLRVCTNCMADNLRSVTINPDGELGLCEHFYNDVIIGNVNSSYINREIIQEWQEPLEKPECRACSFMPQCTKISHCPVGGCTNDSKANLELQIRTSMKDLYRRNIANGKNN